MLLIGNSLSHFRILFIQSVSSIVMHSLLTKTMKKHLPEINLNKCNDLQHPFTLEQDSVIVKSSLVFPVHRVAICKSNKYYVCFCGPWILRSSDGTSHFSGIPSSSPRGVEPPSTRQLELQTAWDQGGILRPVQS